MVKVERITDYNVLFTEGKIYKVVDVIGDKEYLVETNIGTRVYEPQDKFKEVK